MLTDQQCVYIWNSTTFGGLLGEAHICAFARAIEREALATTSTEPAKEAAKTNDAASDVMPPTRGTDSQRGATIRHPIQPLEVDHHHVLRFKRNKIVEFLSEGRLNELAVMGFPPEDWEQLAQLIGYSLSGFGELSYVTDETYNAAAAQYEQSEASRGAAQGRITQDNGVGSSPTDAGGLTRYDEVAEYDGGPFLFQSERGEYVKFAEVESLLATKAAQPAHGMEIPPAGLDEREKFIWTQGYQAAKCVSPAPSAKQEPSEKPTYLDVLSLIRQQMHRVYASAIDREEIDSKYMREIEDGMRGLAALAAPSASASPADQFMRIKVDYKAPFCERGWLEVFAQEFTVEDAEGHRFAVHNHPSRDGVYTATHIETGFAVAQGSTPEEAIERARETWAKAAPEERAAKLASAKSLTGITKERAKTDAIGADSIFPEFVESTAVAAPVAGSQQVPEAWDAVPKLWNDLYVAVNHMMVRLGAVGELDARGNEACSVDAALHAIDGGTVSKRALELHEKAHMPLFQASELALREVGPPPVTAIAAAPAVPVPVGQQWISVEERLPEVGQAVAFVAKTQGAFEYLNGRVLGGKYSEGGFSMPGLVVDASHWMPLPAAPSLQQPKEWSRP